ncbi:MAG: hypothetical protein KC800_27850, partial [Candidatus Eremiobacteraeota bacterium]|nr:hypothetical protein [Candidatus Eremiobacteraeota bacterium]
MKRFIFVIAILLLGPLSAQEDPSSWGQPQDEYLISASKLYVTPDKVVPNGKIYVKDGVVKAVGTDIVVPSGVRTLDFSDRTIHAAFLDPYVAAKEVGLKETPATPVSGTHPKVHDDFLVSEHLKLKDDALKDYRKQGFAVVAIAPGQGIFRGRSGLYKTAPADEDSQLLLNPSAYSVIAFEEGGWDKLKGENYPLSMMGNVALIRQTFLDCAWYSKWRDDPSLGTLRPDYQGTLESLRAVQLGGRPVFLEAGDYLETLRFFAVSREIGLTNTVVVLSGEEWKNLDWFKAVAQGRFVLPLDFPETVEPKDGISEEQLTLDLLTEWFAAPANPRWLREKGFRFSLTTNGLK